MRCAAAAMVSTGYIEHRCLAREVPDEAPRSPKLLERAREALRVRHYSRRTEKAYVGWIGRYIVFHGKRHPREMGPEEVTRFLKALAVDAKVSASWCARGGHRGCRSSCHAPKAPGERSRGAAAARRGVRRRRPWAGVERVAEG